MARALAFDVGGSTLRAAVVEADGTVLRRAKRAPADRAPQALLDDLWTMAEELRDADDRAAPGGLPIGLGIAAQLWIEAGEVAVAPNLGWRDVPLRRLAEARFGRQVRLANDVNAIAVGEARVGAGQGERDVVVVFVGTGVGMGAVVDGKLLEGADGLATELGHIKIEGGSAARLCECGERGCLEAYTSGRHLPELLAAKVAGGTPSPLFAARAGRLRELSAGAIEEAAASGDRACAEVLAEVSERLGLALGNLVTLFNPRVFVLGGGVLAAAPGLRAKVEEKISAYAGTAQRQGLSVRAARLGDDAGLVGAALLALEP